MMIKFFHRVEGFLKKCFDGVAKVRFTSDLQVVALVSHTEQELLLCEPVDTVCHRGHVEKWFANVEKTMKNTIFQVLTKRFHTSVPVPVPVPVPRS